MDLQSSFDNRRFTLNLIYKLVVNVKESRFTLVTVSLAEQSPYIISKKMPVYYMSLSL